MSYARFGWGGSDVYVYMGSGGIECCGCILQKYEEVEIPELEAASEEDKKTLGPLATLLNFNMRPVGEEVITTFPKTEDAVAHFERHIAEGHNVPENVIPDLLAEKEDNEQFLKTGVFLYQQCYSQVGEGVLDLCYVKFKDHGEVPHEFQKKMSQEAGAATREKWRAEREERKAAGEV